MIPPRIMSGANNTINIIEDIIVKMSPISIRNPTTTIRGIDTPRLIKNIIPIIPPIKRNNNETKGESGVNRSATKNSSITRKIVFKVLFIFIFFFIILHLFIHFFSDFF